MSPQEILAGIILAVLSFIGMCVKYYLFRSARNRDLQPGEEAIYVGGKVLMNEDPIFICKGDKCHVMSTIHISNELSGYAIRKDFGQLVVTRKQLRAI